MISDSLVEGQAETVWSMNERSGHMGTVSPHHDLSRRILSMLAGQPGLLMDQILDRCPDTTWNQVFSVVDRLSRTGQIRLTARAPGVYRVDIQGVENKLSAHE